MSARKKKKNQINLLPQKGFASTLSGRVLLWVLSTFRIVVIVTEIIVMIAFLSRFWLDAQHTDLNEEIQQKQAVIEATQNFESEFKDTQKRLSIFSKLATNDGPISNNLKAVTSTMPPDIFLNSIGYSESGIHLSGVSPNERSIQQYLANLGGSRNFKTVSLGAIDIGKDNSSLMSFTITLTL